MAYVSSNYVSSSNIVTAIKGFLDAGSKGGTFLALTCTNTPDATKSYRIRYTTTPGASSQILEAWESTDPSLYYVATANVNANYIGTWQQFALNSKLTTRIETYPLFIEKVISSASNWLSFTFQVKKGDVFCWSQGATSSNPDTQYTIQISGSVHGTYANGATSVSAYNNAKMVAAYTAQADEIITISSYVNSSATFHNGAVTVKHAT